MDSSLTSMTINDLDSFANRSAGNKQIAKAHLQLRTRSALVSFVKEPSRLLSLMDNTSSYISGSLALSIVLGSCEWTSGDMDIYTHWGSFSIIQRYLMRDEGYDTTFVELA